MEAWLNHVGGAAGSVPKSVPEIVPQNIAVSPYYFHTVFMNNRTVAAVSIK
jgi:hypothetical protein